MDRLQNSPDVKNHPASPDHSDAGLGGVYVSGCWIGGLLTSRKFWLGFLAAFVIIGAHIWAWGHVMRPDYEQTEPMWRPYREMSPVLFAIAAALKAFAYTALIFGFMRTTRWFDAIAAGVKLGLIGIALGIISYNIMPFRDWIIPLKWAAGYFVEAILVAVAIKLVNHACVKRK